MATTYYWAKVALPDPPSYFGGYKEDRVKKWGILSRALSDRQGQYEAVDFSWVVSDYDRKVRKLLAGVSTQYFKNSPVVVRMIDDDSRRLLLPPRTVLRGYVSDYRPISQLEFEFKAQDLLTSRFAAVGNDPQKVPKRMITAADFADAPLEALKLCVPVIYNSVSDSRGDTTVGGGGTDNGPVIPTVGGVPFGEFQFGIGLLGPEMGGVGAVSLDPPHRSFGVLPGTVPTSPTVTATAGGSLPFSRNNSWSAMVTAVHAGVESDPSPMANAAVDFDAGQRSILVQWTAASGGADGYRIYVSNNPFGVNTAMSTFFTSFRVASDFCWVFEVGGGVTSLSVTGAGADYSFERDVVYKITAVLPDLSESPASAEIVALISPYRRPAHIRWRPYTNAIGYKIYRRPYTGTTPTDYDTTITLGANGQTGVQVIDGINQLELFDPLDGSLGSVGLVPPPPGGQVKPIYVGTETIAGVVWSRFLVAGHACKTIGNIYKNGVRVAEAVYGASLLAPGKPNWPFGTNYRDINGHRYTLIYAKDAYATEAINGDKPLTVNVDGIENVGDSTGTLITGAFNIYLHALQNWVVGDYQTGSYLLTPTFYDDPSLGQIDEASFATCAAVSVRRISSGYLGAGVIGEDGQQITVRDLIARFNVSWDCDSGFNRKCQFMVSMVDESISQLTGAVPVTDQLDVYSRTFEVSDDLAAHANVIPYFYQRDYSGRQGAGWLAIPTPLEDATSITNYTKGGLSGKIKSPDIQLWFTRDSTTANDVAARRLMRQKNPPRIVKLGLGLNGYNLDLGQIISLTHYEGVGVVSGYVNQPMRIIRHEGDVDNFVVTLECYDMKVMFEGAAILGDRSTLPASRTSATGNQLNYFYLCDRTTGQFSDGSPGDRLR